MGLISRARGVQAEVIEDITCDICGKSTRDSMGMNFEYAEFAAEWGYGSSRDTESWDYFLCEKHAEQIWRRIEKMKEHYARLQNE